MAITFLQKHSSRLKEGAELFASANAGKDPQERILTYRTVADLAYDLLKSGALLERDIRRARELRYQSKNKEIDVLINQHRFEEVKEVIKGAVAVSMELEEYDNAVKFVNKAKRAAEAMQIIEFGGSARL